ncbi:CUB domain-containing protein [Kordia algicida OT-1]|uniref:CUB domain-containing protein n=2 Tax=Kordia TaxID=221065 RepID=A9E2C3_9FLAO|nr:CUB domain-containing protein [Kordia algicida OT-1]
MQNGNLDVDCTASPVFLDSGGSGAGQYSNNENFVLTLCPSEAGQSLRMDFTSFGLQNNSDFMDIFDGPDTSAPLIGTYTGVGSPGLVEASGSNTSGCLTVRFVSDNAGVNIGWQADLSCFVPCQTITANLDSSVPAVSADDIIRICLGDPLTLNGSGTFANDGTGATYEWDLGDTTILNGASVTHTYTQSGIYRVNLTIRDDNPANSDGDPDNDCMNVNVLDQLVYVSTPVDFTGTQAANPEICFGESTDITGMAVIPPFEDCAPEIFDQTWLQDTVSTGTATSYNSQIEVDCYGDGQVITDVAQINQICIVMEHSFMGDLDMILTAPNGAQVVFISYGDGSDPGDNLGVPDQADNGNPGTGWEYCFSPTATQTLDDAAAGVTTIPAGTYAPLASSSFDNLLGAPLNGTWTFEIIDTWAADDGTLFSWNLDFDSSLLPPPSSIVTEEWLPDASITNTAGNVITVQPTTAGQHCYTYQVIDDLGCEYTETVCIDVAPEINNGPASNLSECSNNATEVFDLTVNTAQVLAPIADTTDMVVTYHLSQADADSGANPLTDAQAQAYTGSDGEEIFVRITYNGTTTIDCFATSSFTLNIGNTTANSVPDIVLCDVGNDNQEEFDLCSQTATALGALDPADYTVTYHDTQADADANQNPLPCLYTNMTSPTDDIYVRIEDNNDASCFAVTSFDLVLNPEPTVTAPADMVVCDDASNDGVETFDLTTQIGGILGTQDPMDFTISFHANATDADANANPLSTMYSNVNPTDLIVVRVEDNTTNCVSTTQFNVVVDPLPIANPVADITVCDDDSNDGTEPFDLDALSIQVLGTQDAAIFSVTFHPTQADADAGTNALTSPYNSDATVDCETIFVRIVNINNTTCVDTTSFEICVDYQPTAVQPPNMVVCDDASNDGVETFDLTTQIPIIRGTQDPADVTINFHASQADADANANPLPTTYTNTGTTPTDIIYVSVTSTDATNSCNATTSFEVTVNPLPVAVVPTTLEECDDDTDGFVAFTLTDADAEILAGQTSTDAMTITYYDNPADAVSGTGTPLTSPYTNTTANMQTVHIRIVNTVTGCVNTSTLDLQVNPGIVGTTPSNYSVCDDTNGNDTDQLGTFDLSTLDAQILGALAGTATVTYYETGALAQAGTAGTELPVMYTNTSPSLQIIHARVTDDVTGCFDVVEVTLIVDPLPNLENIPPMIACDFNNPGDMMEMFDLTEHTTTVENGQVGLTITYHETQADADNNTAAVTNVNGTDGQIIWVRAENLIGCVQVGSFEIQVPQLPVITNPTTLEACDDETADGIAPVDLSIKNDEITQSNPDLVVSYHLTDADADTDMNALVLPYENTSSPTTYTVSVRVEDINTGCHVVTQLTVNINDTPGVFQPTPLEYCDTDNDGFGIFDIRSTENEITGGLLPGQVTVTYHETPEDADNNVNSLPDTYTNINAYNQTIYVRVENVLTGCYNVVSLDLIVYDSPEIAALDATSLSECDDASADQIAQFDLTEAEADLLNGEDPLTHTVRYYNTQANATAGTTTGEINNVNAYSNIPPSPQVIWVRVEDQNTGCASITNLTLIVDELPVLTQLPGLETCDAVTLNDGIEVFDLTSLAEDLLNSQPGISLQYFASQTDLDNNTPIADPSAYSNAEVGVQTIFVLATNDTTGCQNTITFDIRVNPLPSPTLDPNGMLSSDTCDDDNDGFVAFDLDALTNDIINNEPDVVYSFHETQADANNNLNALPSPYTNIVMDSQTIYVLATNTVTGCFTVTPLTLNVISIPEIPINLTDLEECDEEPSDGFAMFDLSETQTEIYGSQTPSDFTLTYHESEQDAIDDVSPIVNVTDYINTTINQQTIWVRLEDNATECYAIESFDIIVVAPPVLVQPTAFSLCDDAESGDESDEISSFDLTDKYIEITGGDTSLTLTYYASQTDLDNDTPIADPTAYQNISNPQVLYIRASNAAGCTTDITMTLRVLPIPTPNTSPDVLEACDDNSDGDATNGMLVFDLTQSEAEIVNNESNVTVSYHTTQEDADGDINPIADPTMHTVDMANANMNGQVIIYVRVESDIQIDSNMLPCYKVVELPVVVHPLPELTDIAFNYVFCEYDNDDVGQFDWDVVTSSLDLLTAPQMVADFTVTYHPTVADALANTNALANGFENTSDPQTVFIRVENNVTGCVNTNNIASLELSVEPIPTATAPDTYELCAADEAAQDTAVFDLTSLDAEIINGQTDMAVSYYETATDADMDSNAITNTTSYTNTSNPQTLYARVRQTITGCLSDPVVVNLQVNPLPVFTLPEDDILCVDAETGLALETRTIGVDFGAGYTYSWTTPNGTATTATVEVTTAGTYSVTVIDANNETNCSYSDSVTYEASSAPSLLDIQITTPAFADTHNVIATASGGSGVYEYQLDDGEWQESGEFLDLQPGEHTVTVRDNNGCGELVRTFELIDYMKFFTPNGDEYHPTWNIIGLRNQPGAKIYIFDRYGKLLKQISPAGQGWDGTFNGVPMPSNDYWFRVEYVDPFDGSPKEFINHFTLKR